MLTATTTHLWPTPSALGGASEKQLRAHLTPKLCVRVTLLRLREHEPLNIELELAPALLDVHIKPLVLGHGVGAIFSCLTSASACRGWPRPSTRVPSIFASIAVVTKATVRDERSPVSAPMSSALVRQFGLNCFEAFSTFIASTNRTEICVPLSKRRSKRFSGLLGKLGAEGR